MQELNNTQYFKVEAEKDLDVRCDCGSLFCIDGKRLQSG